MVLPTERPFVPPHSRLFMMPFFIFQSSYRPLGWSSFIPTDRPIFPTDRPLLPTDRPILSTDRFYTTDWSFYRLNELFVFFTTGLISATFAPPPSTVPFSVYSAVLFARARTTGDWVGATWGSVTAGARRRRARGASHHGQLQGLRGGQ